jgi:hypothetical protein
MMFSSISSVDRLASEDKNRESLDSSQHITVKNSDITLEKMRRKNLKSVERLLQWDNSFLLSQIPDADEPQSNHPLSRSSSQNAIKPVR